MRTAVAVGSAAAVNALLLVALANLNTQEMPTVIRPDRPPVLMVLDALDRPPVIEPPEPEPAAPHTPVMTVDLDVPQTQPLAPTPLDLQLDLPTPTLAPVQVVVAVRPPQPPPPPPARTSPRPAPAVAAAVSNTPAEADRVDQPPRELSNPQPRYPTPAMRRSIEGSVTVRLLINTEGRVEDAQITQCDGHESFRQAVLDVVGDWRFVPAAHRGQNVKVWGVKTFRFEMGMARR
jgi:periplasmic protein TonB